MVDAHVHLWDPARTDWYPYLSGRRELDMGDVSGMSRRFDVPTYLAEAAGWNVEKLVNVAAATGRHSIDETLELDRRADVDGHPDAIIGGLPPTDSVAEAVALLDRQMAAPRFRGVRPMGAADGPLPADDVLRALQERDLVFELMAHPDQLQATAEGWRPFDELVVVVEHAGWPRTAPTRSARCGRAGIDALAGLGDNVVCKLSGLAMPLGIDGRRRAGPVARARHRGVRRRPVHVREQLPRRRDARHLRRALLRPTRPSRPASTTTPATSCSPPTRAGLPLLARCVNRAVQCQASVGEHGFPSLSATVQRGQLAGTDHRLQFGVLGETLLGELPPDTRTA